MNINYIHINWNKLKNKDKNNYFIYFIRSLKM